MVQNIEFFKNEFLGKSIDEVLKFISGKNVVFTTSLGVEDQVVTEVIARNNLDIEIVTLDTGRLFPETYEVWQETEKKYGIKINAAYPDKKQIEHFVNKNGINAFYDSVDLRKECCDLRKIKPLKTALNLKDFWVTGLRKEQSNARNSTELVEYSDDFSITKINPLLNWTNEQVWEYVRANNIPYNKLHDQNYPSIGCACCTRAVQAGENPRLGRWWWEEEGKKECGLHIKGE